MILPSEWLPVIWGGQEPEFETVACLNTDPDDFDPILLEGSEGEVIASVGRWLSDAVALRPMAWKPLLEHDRAGILMAPLFVLNGDMEIDDAADEDELLAEALDMIPTCIAGIHAFWQNYRESPSRRSRSRSGGGRRRLH